MVKNSKEQSITIYKSKKTIIFLLIQVNSFNQQKSCSLKQWQKKEKKLEYTE